MNVHNNLFIFKIFRKINDLFHRLCFSVFAVIFIFFGLSSFSIAAPISLTYQGRILKADGTPLEYSNVSFIFQITDPSGQCVIYQEQINSINMSNSAGVFDVPIGTATIQYPLGGTATVLDAFNNSSSYTCGSCSAANGVYACANGSSSYTASANDIRKLRVTFYDGSGWRTIIPDNTIRSVPFAAYSVSAQKLGTNSASDFLLKAGLPTCGAGTFLTWSGSALTCGAVSGSSGGTVTAVTSSNSYLSVATGTSTPALTVNVGTIAGTLAAGDDSRISGAFQTSTSLGGDLTGTLPNPAVSKINGVSVSSAVVGDDGVGTTAPAYKLDVAGDINTSTCFRIGATTVSGTCTSDVRLKENIQDYDVGLKELLGVRLRTYQFNGLGEMPKTGETAVGVIAQEIERTNPELVKNRLVKMRPEDQEQTEIKVVDYSKFTYMLINAVKELYTKFLGHDEQLAAQSRQIASVQVQKVDKAEIEILKARAENSEKENAALKEENAAIKARLERIEKILQSK